MSIIPNPALALLLVLPFLVSMAVLYLVLFKPMLQYLDGREAQTATARQEAAQLTVQIEDRLGKLDLKLAAARKEAMDLRSEARIRAQAHEQNIVAAARRDAEARLAEAIGQIADARAEASATLRVAASTLSRDVASQVLGRAVAKQEAAT